MSAAGAGAAPPLLRACVLADGTVLAAFADSSLLLLTPHATAFLHCDAAGAQTRGCSDYPLHSAGLPAKLVAAAELRNTHFWAPALVKPFLGSAHPVFPSSVPVGAVRWPASAAEAAGQEGLLTVSGDGTVTLVSEDRCAKLVLHPSGLRLAVTWPLQTQQGAVWHQQAFSAADCPACWDAPLRLAAAAQQGWVAQQEQQKQQQEQGEDSAAQRQQGGNSLGQDEVRLSPVQRISQLPPAAAHRGIEACAFPETWWADRAGGTLPPDAVVLLEWTPDAL